MSIIYCPNKSSAERENGAVYARLPEKALIGILNSPVKWMDNRVEVDKILFILAILQYNLYILCWIVEALGSLDSF